ncbi:MAG: nitroreductase family protein [Candidatus Symbiothrix sp.]|jgi:nitroreductase|nr:nitroreductase family protein [Candidatus Symbiothrix sp.]
MKQLFVLMLSVIAITSCLQKEGETVSKKDAALSVIYNRKSVRSYTSQAVSKKDVQTLLKAGFSAPSAKDIRPWELIVLDDRAVLDKFAEEGLRGSRIILHEAPLAIVICGDTVKSTRWSLDCSAVTENILLAAEASDLGAVWLAVFPWRDRIERVMKTLDLPPNILPLAVVAVGHPKGEFTPKDKYDEGKIHWNKW